MSDNLGELQQLVMLALVRLGDEAYGARIRKELEQVAARTVAISTIYITLVRLEDQGLVSSREGDYPGRGGRRRRYFDLTEAGLGRLRHARKAANRMWTGFEEEILGREPS